MTHVITAAQAYEIDLEWSNASENNDMLRIVSYRGTGNSFRATLCIPGNDNAPRYEYKRHDPETGEYAPGYYHQNGPTLDEWLMQAEYRDAADTTAGLIQF